MILPSNFEETNTLSNMKVGQQGFIVPWGMWVDLDGNCFLNENYTFQGSPGGTVQLKITRVEGGYIAHIGEMKEKYNWSKKCLPSYMSPSDVCYGKVVGFGVEDVIKQTPLVKSILGMMLNWN